MVFKEFYSSSPRGTLGDPDALERAVTERLVPGPQEHLTAFVSAQEHTLLSSQAPLEPCKRRKHKKFPRFSLKRSKVGNHELKSVG